MPVDFDLDRPRTLLASCPVYHPSALVRCETAGNFVWIKDETDRMGLGAFKALGGVYAVARLLEDTLPVDPSGLPPTLDALRSAGATRTFVCASAGNHGMAVAAGARLFGASARIHLSDTVAEAFALRLRARGATVVRSGATYEDSIKAAVADAAQNGAIHLADGSWPGYTEPPRLVMEGYTVIGSELCEQFAERQTWPSHVYLQAGVGGLAAAVAYVIRTGWPVQPEIVVVEPDAAPCLRDSVRAGHVVEVAGPVSAMGRLDCKVPSMLAFDLLREMADRFVTVSDAAGADAAEAARKLGFETTSSGAAGLAGYLAETAPVARPLVILSEKSPPRG